MSAGEISLIVFGFTFGGAVVGTSIRKRLPDDHLSSDSRDVIKLAVGTVATLSALVLGLLIASAKSSFDTKDAEVVQLATNIILLDRQLVHYGPEAQGARELLRLFTNYKIDAIWKVQAPHSAGEPDGWTLFGDLQDSIRGLTPGSPAQQIIQSRALQLGSEIAAGRSLLELQTESSISAPFLWILLFWLTIIFASFGFLTSPNATIVAALLVCALSVSSAIFLILEMDIPFQGLIQVSSAPMREALAHIR
jgi:hypothetical protein